MDREYLIGKMLSVEGRAGVVISVSLQSTSNGWDLLNWDSSKGYYGGTVVVQLLESSSYKTYTFDIKSLKKEEQYDQTYVLQLYCIFIFI